MSDTRLNRIDDAMQRCVDTTPIPGIVTLVYRRGELLHHRGFGVLGPEGEPMRTDAIFRIYSMTKPIVCSALLTLYEEGAFQLADPVAHFIPGFADVRVYAGPETPGASPGAAPVTLQATRTAAPHREVTIRDLLTHTAGLTYPWMEYARWRSCTGATSPICPTSRLPTWCSSSRDAAGVPAGLPGSRYGLCHDVAARLIEVISGVPLDRFCRNASSAPWRWWTPGSSCHPRSSTVSPP